MIDCFIGLGGNYPQTLETMRLGIKILAEIQGISSLASSRVYQTSPISPIFQPPYLNSVCFFNTSLSLLNLWKTLTNLELQLGKETKPKEAPRLIDIDLLFYGDHLFYSSELVVPHPRWHERLFVLAPLSDLVDTINLPYPIYIRELKNKFLNPHQEHVVPLNTTLPYTQQRSCHEEPQST